MNSKSYYNLARRPPAINLLSFFLVLLTTETVLCYCKPVDAADEWRPITPEELKMTSEPKAPGASAIILYRQVDRDDSYNPSPHEFNYVRKKIFTEEGRKNADVEIPVIKGEWDIRNV